MATKKQEIVEFEMTAVIPVAQYANLQPVVKGYGTTWEEARDDATSKVQQLWNMYAENKDALRVVKPSDTPTVAMEQMKCFLTGDVVDFDPAGHKYYYEGERLMSGSGYASQFEHEFDKQTIAKRCEKKLEATAEDIIAYWDSKADCSTTFGTALHQALEHYGKYLEINSRDITNDGTQKPLGINPVLLPIVEAYFKDKEKEQAVYEPFVADTKNKRCGQIDRLQITGDKKCILRDYKTNADLDKLGQPKSLKAPFTYLPNTPLSKYSLQLSFYKAIIESAGWTVEKAIVDWYNATDNAWEEIEVKTYPLEELGDKIDLSKVAI